MKSNIFFLRNHICQLLVILALTVVVFGCSNLEEDTSGVLVVDSFFKTESDLDAAVVAIYREFIRNGFVAFGSTDTFAPLMGGDDITAIFGGNKLTFSEFDVFNANSANGRLLGSSWQKPYDAIYAANTVLANIDNVDGDSMVIAQGEAQARFLRALAYFWMVRLYGDLPLVTSPEPDTELSRSPVSDVYALIESDLLFAEQNLPESWDVPGRPTVWAAKSLLSKVYLTMAGWPLKDASKYPLAAQRAKDVIDNSPHQLLPNYADLWPIDNQNNIEQIFNIQFCKNGGGCGFQYFSTLTGRSSRPPEESGFNDFFAEIGFFNRFPEGPRKDATFHTSFTQDDGTPIIEWNDPTASTGHPYYAKYRSGGISGQPGFEHPFQSSRPFTIIRYAEVLLIYAEAQARADGAPNAMAYDAINEVRTRAGLNNLSPVLGEEAFVDAVIDERGWEFAAEMIRWFDLIRTEKVEESITLKDPMDNQPAGAVTKDKYLAPIPASEILLNPNLTQNPGY